jgi:hypothetical protein
MNCVRDGPRPRRPARASREARFLGIAFVRHTTVLQCSEHILVAYLTELGAEPVGAAALFWNRSGAPYSKDTLGDDFRTVRTIVFGPEDIRLLADFRRSGAVEAVSGEATPSKMAAKMANTISTSNKLHKTYSPAQLDQVT